MWIDYDLAPKIDLPPSEWSKISVILDHEVRVPRFLIHPEGEYPAFIRPLGRP